MYRTSRRMVKCILLFAFVTHCLAATFQYPGSPCAAVTSSYLVPAHAPTGQIVCGFPQWVILDSSAVITNSYLINYSTPGSPLIQYTVEWTSSYPLSALYNEYLLTLTTVLGPGWTITNSTNTSTSGLGTIGALYATSENAAIQVVITASAGKTDVIATYVAGAISSAAASPPPVGIGPAEGPTSQEASSNEPVSTGSGNYYYQHTDLSVAGRGLPVTFQRAYNAGDSYMGPLGMNWNYQYNIVLSEILSGTISIRWGDGHGESYTLVAGEYAPQSGVHNTLTADADGAFTLTEKNLTRYSFSPVGKLIAVADRNGNTVDLRYDANGNLTTITAAGGRTLRLTYDASERIVRVTDSLGRVESYTYSTSDDLVSAIDPLGGVTKYTYDAVHHVTQITLPNGNKLLNNLYDSQGRVTAQTNGRGFTWQFAYNTPSEGQTTITDARGSSTVHTYDSNLRIVGIADALGHSVGYTYDLNNNLTSITDKNSHPTSFSYDSNGNVTGITDPLLSTKAFSYDVNNNLLTATNPKGKVKTFSYDANGNLIGVQDALGNKTSFSYDSFGEMISRKDAAGNSMGFSYSAEGDLTKITDALGCATAFAYDGAGRLISITDPNHHSTASVYDALNRVTKVSDPLGHATLFSYDAIGNVISVTDANGHKTQYGYDADNDLATITDALGHVTTYAYDADDNRITFTNAKQNATKYQHDVLNRLILTTDPLSFETSYTYDPVGNIVAITDPKGQTNRFAYDALNRLLSITYADNKNVAYSYDVDGNRATMTDWNGATGYTYDDLDRLTGVMSPGNISVAYAYTAAGKRSSVIYPNKGVALYRYDADERLSGVSDWQSRTTGYAYDPAGNLLRVEYPNKTEVDFAYDAANRLSTVVNTREGVSPRTIDYTMDAVGNRIVVNDSGIPVYYGYDALNELTSAQLSLLRETWSYDPVGNRQSDSFLLSKISYTYDAADRLLQAGARSFTYDADGNEISVSDALLRTRHNFTFDAANQLVAVDNGTAGAYMYDGDGNRVSKSTLGWTERYVNDIAQGLPVVLQNESPGGTSSYFYGLSLMEQVSSQSTDFYQYDGLGSVIGLTDSLGRPETAYAYDPWGNAILPSAGSTPFRFAGQALDPVTGLYYLRARYYDPTIGRLISRDSFAGFAANPLSANKYAYSLNRPTVFSDPSGFAAENTSASANVVETIIQGGCAVVGAVQTVLETTADFLASAGIYYIASNGGSQPVSNVPCYSDLPGVGLFFTSVPTAR